MSSSKPGPHGPSEPLPPRGAAQSRFIPREDVIHRGSAAPAKAAPTNQAEAAEALGYGPR